MNKFYLMTIEGRRWVTAQMTLVSTGVYKVSVAGINFSKLMVDGVNGSNNTSPITNADTLYSCYLDLANSELQIRADAADITAIKNFVVYYIISVTNEKDLYWNIDPDSPNTRLVLYESRLTKAPNFSQSQENNLVGLLSVSTSNINLINSDWALKKYMTSIDSLKDARVRIWECVDDLSVRTKFYTGFVQRFTLDTMAVITISDIFKRLENILYSNTTFANSIVQAIPGNQPYASEDPIYRLYGRNSSFKLLELKLGALSVGFNIIPDSMPPATCVSYNSTPSTSNNRVWATGYIEDISGTEETYVVTSVNPIPVGINIFFQVGVAAGGDNFTVGDTIKLSAGGYGIVALLSGLDTEVIVNLISGAAILVGSNMKIHKISTMMIVFSGVSKQLVYGRDYNVNAFVPGNPISITLVNNFETTVGLGRALDPSQDKIYYKARNVVDRPSYSHGAQIKKLLLTEYDANDLNITSFDDADIALDLNLCYQVPPIGSSFIPKRDYLEQLLTSSLGYLYIGDDFKITYGNYSVSDALDVAGTLSDIEIEKQTISHEIDYQDLYIGANFKSENFGNTINLKDQMAQYLHGGNKTFDIVTLTECFSNALISLIPGHFKNIMSFYSVPRILTSVTNLDIRAKIGQKKKIQSSKGLTYPNATVISTNDYAIRQELELVNLTKTQGKATASINGSADEVI